MRALLLAVLLLPLAACMTTETGGPAIVEPAASPSGITVERMTGRWGLASYFSEADKAKTLASARGACGHPYDIARGPNGGVMMHLPQDPATHELFLSSGLRATIGPKGGEPGVTRDVVEFTNDRMILKWQDAQVANVYGTMVFVRCGGR